MEHRNIAQAWWSRLIKAQVVLPVVYKILFGMVETDASIFFRVRNTSTVTRGHSLKLFVPQSRLDVRKYFFCHRVVHCWNSLPAQPDDFSSLNTFKRLLERADLSGFISCTD